MSASSPARSRFATDEDYDEPDGVDLVKGGNDDGEANGRASYENRALGGRPSDSGVKGKSRRHDVG